MKSKKILLLELACIVVAFFLVLTLVGVSTLSIVTVYDEISNKVLAAFVALLLLVVCILTGYGISWGINEVLGVIENWDREKGIGLLSDAEESKLIADVREKGSRFIVVDEDGEMHEYYVLTEDDQSSGAQKDSDDTTVRYYVDDVKAEKTS